MLNEFLRILSYDDYLVKFHYDYNQIVLYITITRKTDQKTVSDTLVGYKSLQDEDRIMEKIREMIGRF